MVAADIFFCGLVLHAPHVLCCDAIAGSVLIAHKNKCSGVCSAPRLLLFCCCCSPPSASRNRRQHIRYYVEMLVHWRSVGSLSLIHKSKCGQVQPLHIAQQAHSCESYPKDAGQLQPEMQSSRCNQSNTSHHHHHHHHQPVYGDGVWMISSHGVRWCLFFALCTTYIYYIFQNKA